MSFRERMSLKYMTNLRYIYILFYKFIRAVSLSFYCLTINLYRRYIGCNVRPNEANKSISWTRHAFVKNWIFIEMKVCEPTVPRALYTLWVYEWIEKPKMLAIAAAVAAVAAFLCAAFEKCYVCICVRACKRHTETERQKKKRKTICFSKNESNFLKLLKMEEK